VLCCVHVFMSSYACYSRRALCANLFNIYFLRGRGAPRNTTFLSFRTLKSPFPLPFIFRMKFMPETNCFKCLFCQFTCCGLWPFTGVLEFEGDKKFVFRKPTFWGCCRGSPIPCCMGCGYGPCAQEGTHILQPDGTWKGEGGPFPGDPGCCSGCCTQEHNTWKFEKDPTSKETASTYTMSQGGAMNCAIPPCANGSSCNCCPCCPEADHHMIGWVA